MNRLSTLAISTWLFLGFFGAAAAQVPTNAQLTTSPNYPEPEQEVTVSISDFAYDTASADIVWYIDGEVIEGATNRRSIALTTKTAGETTAVRAEISGPNTPFVQASKVITPVQLDLLIEANTLTPSFYQGRSLPSPGSQVRVTAVPFEGATSAPGSYSYRWEVGEDVIDGGSVKGKNFVVFTSNFEKNVQVKVTVFNQRGAVVTSRSIYVPINDPELYFYEINPLRGLLPIALNDPHIFVGEELRVRAEPFYFDPTAFSNVLSEWKLDGRTVPNEDNPLELTLRRQGDIGSFSLGFEIRNLSQLLQGVKERITINL